MRVAISINDIVINIVEAPTVALAKSLHPGATAFTAGDVGIGWAKGGSSWVAPPAPALLPRTLTHLEFIEHAQAAGDLSDAELVAAKNDANLAAFWLKFEMATSLERDNATTLSGLQALVLTGHLTEQAKQTVIDQWPTA